MATISESNTKSMGSFFVIWTGQAFSLFGSQLVQFSLIWWLTSQTGSATVLAMAALVGLLPQVLLGPFVGTLVDRWNRRVTLIASDALVALATFALAILFFTGLIQIWHLYLIMFARALAGSFHWPAMAASTSLMVPEKHLTRVQGINQVLHGAMNIASAPLAALLLSVVSILLAIAVIFVVGITLPMANGPLQAVIQVSVSPEMQGRVFSLLASAASAMTPLGMAVAGPVADIIGIRTWLVVAGVVTALAGIVAFFIPL